MKTHLIFSILAASAFGLGSAIAADTVPAGNGAPVSGAATPGAGTGTSITGTSAGTPASGTGGQKEKETVVPSGSPATGTSGAGTGDGTGGTMK